MDMVTGQSPQRNKSKRLGKFGMKGRRDGDTCGKNSDSWTHLLMVVPSYLLNSRDLFVINAQPSSFLPSFLIAFKISPWVGEGKVPGCFCQLIGSGHDLRICWDLLPQGPCSEGILPLPLPLSLPRSCAGSLPLK